MQNCLKTPTSMIKQLKENKESRVIILSNNCFDADNFKIRQILINYYPAEFIDNLKVRTNKTY